MNKEFLQIMKDRLRDKVSQPSCREVMHPLDATCNRSSLNLFLRNLIGSAKIYIPFYLMGAIFSRKILQPKYVAFNLVPDIFRSSLMIAVIAFVWSRLLCAGYQMSGRHLKSTFFLAPLIGSWLGILVERKSRRRELTVYVAQQAVESVVRMIVSRNFIPYPEFFERNFDNIKTLLFATSTSILFYMQKNEPHLLGSGVKKFISLVLPKENSPDLVERRFTRAYVAARTVTIGNPKPKDNEYHSDCVNCPHNSRHIGCVAYTVIGFLRSFGMGLSIRAFFFLIPRLLNPKKLKWKKLLPFFKRESLNLALFFGFCTGATRAIQCLLRKIRGREDGLNQLVAGFFGGLAFHFNGYTEVCMYVASKAFEGLYMILENRGLIKPFPYGEITVFSVCCATLFYNSLVAPHDIRSSYIRFLARTSNYAHTHMAVWFSKVREELMIGGVHHNPIAYEKSFKFIKKMAKANPITGPII